MSKKTIRGLVGEENGSLYIKLGGFWYLIGEDGSNIFPVLMYRYSFAQIVRNAKHKSISAWKDEDMKFSKRPAIREFSYE